MWTPARDVAEFAEACSNVGHEKTSEGDSSGIRDRLEEAKKDYEEMGGWEAFRSGEWLFNLIRRRFRNYFEKANVEYFRRKYETDDRKIIEAKLIGTAAKNASVLGALTGAAISADELVTLLTQAKAV